MLTFNLFQVDVKGTQTGDGGYYYPDHLPVLGTYRLWLLVLLAQSRMQNIFSRQAHQFHMLQAHQFHMLPWHFQLNFWQCLLGGAEGGGWA